MDNIFLGLGTNLGDRKSNLKQAVELISSGVAPVIASSSIIETKAWGKTDQNDFLNQVVRIQSSISPEELLKKCHAIENQLGRERHEKWGERTIDIDILYYDKVIYNQNELIIPHEYLHEREFVLESLNEIAPDFKHPLLNLTNKELLIQLDKKHTSGN